MEGKILNNNDKNKTYAVKPNTSKNLFYTILLFAVLFILFYSFYANSGKLITESEFYNDLYNDKIESVEFTETQINIYYKSESVTTGNSLKAYMGIRAQEKIEIYIATYNATHDDIMQVNMSYPVASDFDWFSLIYLLLMIGSIIFLITFLSRQFGKSQNKSFEFVKNRAKLTDSKIKFENVAGADEEKREVQEIVEFLKDPKKFTDMGARIPKGVLLVGQPGTGKTLLAKAIAGEANVPFFTMSGSDFMELFVGVGASRVRDLFEQAKKSKPCIIFIDEIDAIGRQRGTGLGGGNDEREQTLNQLLVQMDGFETNEGVIIIGATNRADILDPALLRPGRFDRQIYIHVPDVKGREEILKVHARNKKLDKSVNFKHIARITSGFTGAELENLLNEAAILATRENKTEIGMTDITESIDKVTMGPQKKSRIVTERDKKITAFHESGHAIVGKLVKNNEPIHEVSIIPRGGAAGYTVSRPDTDDNHVTKGKLYDTITMLLAGRMAEKLFLDDISTGASNDIMRATQIAKKMVVEFGMSDKLGLMHLGSENSYFFGKDYVERTTYSETSASLIDKEIKSILDECMKNAEKILTANKKKLNTMVDILLQYETIYSDEVDMIIAGKSKKTISEYIDKKRDEVKAAKVKKTREPKKVASSELKSSIIKTDISLNKENNNQSTSENIKSENSQINTNKKTTKSNKIEVLPSKEISDEMEDVLKEEILKTKDKKKNNE